MSFSFDNNIPIYIQLVEQLKINIISGKIKPGERLPSIRDLAMDNKVNPITMQKAPRMATASTTYPGIWTTPLETDGGCATTTVL